VSFQAIENATLSEYIKLSPRQLRLDRDRGARDAKRGAPALDASTHAFMEEVCAQAAHALNNFGVEERRYTDRLAKKLDDLESERSGKYEVRRNDLVSQKHSALGDLDRTIGPSSHALTKAEADGDSANRQFRDLESRLNRPLRVSLRYGYWIILLLALLIEAPINRLAFELFFQETALVSWGLAILVGCLLLAFAHFAGLSARRITSSDSWLFVAGRLVFVLGVVSIACALMYFVAKVRQAYIAFVESEQAADARLGEILRGESFSLPAFQDLLNIPLGQDGMLLILINFTIFVVAALASFYRHDPHPDYEKLSERRDRADRRLAKLRRRFEEKSSEASRTFDSSIADLDRQIDNADKEIARLDAEMDAARQSRNLNEVRVVKAVKSRILQYQSGNLESRSDGEPRCFVISDNDLAEKILGVGAHAGAARGVDFVEEPSAAG
jgi:hypothetical protein